jgi:predicted O-methyltransferase YrrM
MNTIEAKLFEIHQSIILIGGSMKSEFQEQKLAMEYIEPAAKVLELGSNIGINSIIISKILDSDKNLVTLECDLSHIETLTKNRDTNGLLFNIEPSALSSIPLARKG